MPISPTSDLSQKLVIITGLSGAGKSTAMRVFEDLGCYCVDNLPPSLIANFYNLWQQSIASGGAGVVIASDIRSGALFDDFQEAVESLRKENIDFEILYMDAAAHVLVNRFREVRRAHPLQPGLPLKEAVEEERRRLASIRAIATQVIDTSQMNVPRLRDAVLRGVTGDDTSNAIRLHFVSFGFKYGAPRDADFIIDVRFLPNPFYIPQIRQHTGKDKDVYDYVMSFELAETFFKKLVEMISLPLESFVGVGKYSLNVAIGCTGGHHRSVAFVERLAKHFSKTGNKTEISHRDISKPQV